MVYEYTKIPKEVYDANIAKINYIKSIKKLYTTVMGSSPVIGGNHDVYFNLNTSKHFFKGTSNYFIMKFSFKKNFHKDINLFFDDTEIEIWEVFENKYKTLSTKISLDTYQYKFDTDEDIKLVYNCLEFALKWLYEVVPYYTYGIRCPTDTYNFYYNKHRLFLFGRYRNVGDNAMHNNFLKLTDKICSVYGREYKGLKNG